MGLCRESRVSSIQVGQGTISLCGEVVRDSALCACVLENGINLCDMRQLQSLHETSTLHVLGTCHGLTTERRGSPLPHGKPVPPTLWH